MSRSHGFSNLSWRCLFLAAALICTGATKLQSAEVPAPRVVRIPSDVPGSVGRNYPFFATDIVLKNFGYVEEEFFFEGTANTYSSAEFGKNAEISGSYPYKSRFLVRRPATPSRFNGVVIVEWLNVTNQYDVDVLWLYQKEFFIREGYAWVGVSVQDTGVSNPMTGLKVWSPKRYGTMDVTASGKVTGDGLANDIYGQSAAAVRKVPEVLGGLRPTYVIAAGQSQSASRLIGYLNAVHHRNPVFDAALLTVPPSYSPLREDLTIPIITVLSETERNESRRQADLEKLRVWKVTGATHSEQYSLLSRAAILQRDLQRDAVDACATSARSRVEIRFVYNAATDALVKWKKNGVAPPHSPNLAFDEAAVATREAAAPAAERGGRGRGGAPLLEVIKRDEHGNAIGGIRLAEIEVPVATESALNCGLGGTHLPFEAAKLNTLYPSHDRYVAKVTTASQALVRAGFLLPADAAETIDRAKRSIWGMQLACGPLCADVYQFPKNPSSQLLGNQTRFLAIKDGDTLVRIMDGVTKLIAEAYTPGNAANGKEKFEDAATGIQSYIDQTRKLAARGNMPPETEKLLLNQATTLMDLVRKAVPR